MAGAPCGTAGRHRPAAGAGPGPGPGAGQQREAGRAGSSCNGLARRGAPRGPRRAAGPRRWPGLRAAGRPRPGGVQRRAQVYRGGQHGIEPLHYRAAKAGHHHRQRHGQAQASHHPAHGNCGATAHAACALQRQQRQHPARRQRLQPLQQPGHGAGAASAMPPTSSSPMAP